MTAHVTKRFAYYIADQIFESVSEASPSRLYMFVGRPGPYANDSVVTAPVSDTQNDDYNIYKQMLAAKKLATTDITYALKRYNWSNNVLYAAYDNEDTNLYANTFYVYTTDRNVYKCLFNNKNANSTVQPTGTSTGITETADGYQWKYMYTVSGADNGKFVTDQYIPVKVLTANDGSAQFSTQQASVNGAINIVKVTAGGRGYFTTNGQFASVSNGASFSLANTASANDSIYVGSTIYITSGKGAGLIREITRYAGVSRTVTVNNAFTTAPNTSSGYIVSPKVTVSGDGSGLLAYSNVVASNGAVNYINIISSGVNYSNATVTITANSSHGNSATARAIISPRNGHGKNAREELGGSFVMLTSEFSGTESGTLPLENNIRTFGLLKDPILANGSVANTINFDMTTRMTLTGATGDFNADELITGGTSGATGNVVSFANSNAANTAGTLRVINITGRFQNNEQITGSTSGKKATIKPSANSDLLFYNGDVLYIENRSPITRANEQIENFKIIMGF